MQTSAKQLLDLIQPMYNPTPDWAEHTVYYFKQLEQLLPQVNIRLTIVNDGSSKQISRNDIAYLKKEISSFNYITYATNKGKGYAVRTGVKASAAPLIIYTDIDFPFKLNCIVDMYNRLLQGADVVSGVRTDDYYKSLSVKRKISSKASRFLNRLFLKLPFSDTQSGIKGFNLKGKEYFLKTTIERYLFDTEFLSLVATTSNLTIKTVQIELREGVLFTKMSTKTMLIELKNFAGIYYTAIKNRLSAKQK